MAEATPTATMQDYRDRFAASMKARDDALMIEGARRALEAAAGAASAGPKPG